MTDPNTEAMELWRKAHGAFEYHRPQAAAAIIATKLAELRARIEGLETALVDIRDNYWVENCLDPQWAPNRARQALRTGQLVLIDDQAVERGVKLGLEAAVNAIQAIVDHAPNGSIGRELQPVVALLSCLDAAAITP